MGFFLSKKGDCLKKLFFVLMLLFLPVVFAATNYVDDPANCPTSDATNFPGQSCSPPPADNVICGDNSGTANCSGASLIVAPTVDVNSTTNYSGSFNGGYLINCYASVDSAAPFCDNDQAAWCDRNSTCQNVNRVTQCNANAFASDVAESECVGCRSGFTFCDGSVEDGDGCEVQSGVTNCAVGVNNNINANCTCVCDSSSFDCDAGGAGVGNGCEIKNGSACTIGALSGTYSGWSGAVGNCVVATSNFVTGTQAEYNSDENFLGGINYSLSGNLFNVMNGYSLQRFYVDVNASTWTDTNSYVGGWTNTTDLNVSSGFLYVNGVAYDIANDLNLNTGGGGGGDSSGNLDTNIIASNRWLEIPHDWNATQTFSAGINIAGDLNNNNSNSDANFNNLEVDLFFANEGTMSGNLTLLQNGLKIFFGSADKFISTGSTFFPRMLISGDSFGIFLQVLGSTMLRIESTGITMGDQAAGVDPTFEILGEDSSFLMTWMEDEDRLDFNDDLLMATNEKFFFRDTGIFLNSDTDGRMVQSADVQIQMDLVSSTVATWLDGGLRFATDNNVQLRDADIALYSPSDGVGEFTADKKIFLNTPTVEVSNDINVFTGQANIVDLNVGIQLTSNKDSNFLGNVFTDKNVFIDVNQGACFNPNCSIFIVYDGNNLVIQG